MQLIKHGAVVDDPWQLVSRETRVEDLPGQGPLIVPLPLWLEQATMLNTREDGVGLWLDSDEAIEDVPAAGLQQLPVIALNFPAFTDGRHYSTARLLRERHGYHGEIRAIGDVLRDQLFFMQRCGFDSFAIRADCNPEAALAGLADYSTAYQAAADQPLPLFRRRH